MHVPQILEFTWASEHTAVFDLAADDEPTWIGLWLRHDGMVVIEHTSDLHSAIFNGLEGLKVTGFDE